MHYKTRNKLKTAKKLYTVEPEDDKVIQVKIQLPFDEYVEINLHQPFPSKIVYNNLEHGGFNYDPEIDSSITHRSAENTINVLNNSFNYRNNNDATIRQLITLIEQIPHHI